MRWLAVALVLTAGAASAQTARVQSGDHAGFTRLVIPLGADREWELTQSGNRRWELAVDPAIDGFDISRAFDLIQRSRLAELEAGDTLTLSLACDCRIDSFRYQDRFVVIDIADPDPDAELVAVDPDADPRSEDRERAAEALPDLASLLTSPNQLPTLPLLAVPQHPDPVEGAMPHPEGTPDGDEAGQAEDAPNPRLAEAAEIMAEQLARAAASGLLDPALDQPQTFADPVSARDTPGDVESEPDLGDAPDTQNPHPAPHHPRPEDISLPDEFPIRTQTALDPGIGFEAALPPAEDSAGCGAEPFDPGAWAEGVGFEQELGTLRLALYDDRDVLIEHGARDLALYYLYYGFGAEARYWLNQLQEPPDDLLAVSAIVDGTEVAGFEPITSPAECSDGELLWRYIGGSVAVDLNSVDLAAIQRAYVNLPIPLRDLLGPRLARALHADRHGPAARNVRDVLERGGRIPEAELDLLDFDLGLTPSGSEDDTRGALSDLLTNDGADPAHTMARALAFDRETGLLPTFDRLTAAEALLREYGDGPATDMLWQEVLLGHAALGEVETAISMLGDPARDGPVRETALTELIANRVRAADTAALLILAYSFGENWRPEGSDAGRTQVSAIAILREEGLYEAAQILRDVRRPLILPARAEEETEPDPLVVAWETSDWERLAELAEGPHAAIATRMSSRPDADSPQEPFGDLATLSAAVSDSRDLRQAIGALLADPAPE
ncbi:hypothetical protein HKCCE4037_04900 [Rhodobacterales bacterium HKCCE4037]|nr:hypothetical protein [Rhodobacterales bacterium HKCCE4037]